MTRFNQWHIDPDPNGGVYAATFGPDDFETWFLTGADRNTRFSAKNEQELYDNCKYLAESECRLITQSASELKRDIRNWANSWNEQIDTMIVNHEYCDQLRADGWQPGIYGRPVELGGNQEATNNQIIDAWDEDPGLVYVHQPLRDYRREEDN